MEEGIRYLRYTEYIFDQFITLKILRNFVFLLNLLVSVQLLQTGKYIVLLVPKTYS